MGRPRKQIPEKMRNELKETIDDLLLVDQLMPLMFDKENMSILLSLLMTKDEKGLPFVSIGEITDLGKSQKLVDRLNLMIDYGIIEKTNGNYNLTEFGVSAANFTKKLITLVNEDNKISNKAKFAGYNIIYQTIEQKIDDNKRQIIRRKI